MKTPHSHYRKGTHVFVITKSGESFEDIFEDHKGKFIRLLKFGNILMRNVRAMSFRRLEDSQKGRWRQKL